MATTRTRFIAFTAAAPDRIAGYGRTKEKASAAAMSAGHASDSISTLAASERLGLLIDRGKAEDIFVPRSLYLGDPEGYVHLADCPVEFAVFADKWDDLLICRHDGWSESQNAYVALAEIVPQSGYWDENQFVLISYPRGWDFEDVVRPTREPGEYRIARGAKRYVEFDQEALDADDYALGELRFDEMVTLETPSSRRAARFCGFFKDIRVDISIDHDGELCTLVNLDGYEISGNGREMTEVDLAKAAAAITAADRDDEHAIIALRVLAAKALVDARRDCLDEPEEAA